VLSVPKVDTEAASDLAGRFFDFIIEQRTDRFLEPDRVLAHLDLALAPPNVERLVRERVKPLLERQKERATRRQDQVGDAFTPEAAELLKKRLSKPWQLERETLRRLSQQESVRFMLRNIVQESIDRFVQSLSSIGGTGILGSLGRSAASVGSAVLGTVAPQLESQIKRAASSFVASSLGAIIDRFIDNLTSPEGAARLGQMRGTGFEAFLDLPARKISNASSEFADDSVLALLPAWAAYTIGRREVRDELLGELRALVTAEGSKPLREFIGSPDLVASMRKDVVRTAGPLISEFSESLGFQSWKPPPD